MYSKFLVTLMKRGRLIRIEIHIHNNNLDDKVEIFEDLHPGWECITDEDITEILDY
ncbi:hypothetical protein JJJA_0003 [Achromobacter phage JWDelta]|uniref:Uncharacterized protein n=2 Tax=Jwalphavirus jwalpha TaxID=2169963 RepID=V9VFX8_9CAUD|nr:hypothetical protein CH29_gp03 [Achromobacter phage JWAlpha]AHC56519.1 hypothetical protein JJJA_0003 [Achromobacter phage JWDelta]AHC93956.1 hypothetical protein JJJB_0003 [Achromobacter phage JWAlpha]